MPEGYGDRARVDSPCNAHVYQHPKVLSATSGATLVDTGVVTCTSAQVSRPLPPPTRAPHMLSLSLLTALGSPASSLEGMKQKTTHDSSCPVVENGAVPTPSLGKLLWRKNDFFP